MNIETVRNGLADYPKAEVGVFCNHITFLTVDRDKEGTLRAWWIEKIGENLLIDLFKKVAKDDLYIDGEIISLSYKGKKLTADYSYQAYRKKLMKIHPETIIDPQVVYLGDNFSFQKVSGKIEYIHEFKDPFNQTSEKIVGAYCVVKNSAGEFIEILSKEDATKMEAAAKTKNVWKQWKSRMYLKSVIKRICKTFFHDDFANVEAIDNENYDLENVGVSEEKKTELQNKAKLSALIKEVQVEIKIYDNEDKPSILEKWKAAFDDNKLTVDFVKPIFNKLKYYNLLNASKAEGLEELWIAYETMDEISDEAIVNLTEYLPTLKPQENA